ncbi:MAG: hypothetical protein IJO54_03290 [Oscillospiraceae bacterium]|nr:hypothetical protein [Oscillospiraceae bacterium]
MENFFIGMIFIFLNFNFTVSNHVVGLIPTFVGYIFVKRGINEFEGKVPAFAKIENFSKIMIAVSIVIYIMDFLAVNIGAMYFVVSVVMMAANIYTSFNITEGILWLEENKNVNILGSDLRRMWKISIIALCASTVTVFIPLLNIIAVLAYFVCCALFLVAFNKTKNAAADHYLY